MIDPKKRVYIYFNLHKKVYSVRQSGKVVEHTKHIMLKDCRFLVSQAGREKVLREKKKNVHAGISGYIDTYRSRDEWLPSFTPFTKLATYNPYKYKSFVRADDDTKPVFWSSSVRLSKSKVHFVPCIESANSL